MTLSLRIPLVILFLWSTCASASSSAPAAGDAVEKKMPDATITIAGGVVALGIGFEGRYVGSTFRVRSAISGVRFNFSGNGMRIRLTRPCAASVHSTHVSGGCGA